MSEMTWNGDVLSACREYVLAAAMRGAAAERRQSARRVDHDIAREIERDESERSATTRAAYDRWMGWMMMIERKHGKRAAEPIVSRVMARARMLAGIS